MSLPLKKVKTCNRCTAYDWDSKAHEQSCRLGFDNKSKTETNFGFAKTIPQEPCLKPLTFMEFIEAREQVELILKGKAVKP